MRTVLSALCAGVLCLAFAGPARALCVESFRTADGRYVTRDCPTKEGELWTLLGGVAALAVVAYAINNPGQDYEAASLTVQPVAFDRTLGFDLAYRPGVIPGSLGLRMIREDGAEPRYALRYAIGF